MGETNAMESWVIELENKLGVMDPSGDTASLWARHSIFRVPSHISQIHPGAYQPKMVSLGPYYHDDPRFRAMEEHKLRAVFYFTASNPNKKVSHYAKKLREIASQAMDFYDQLEEKWKDAERFSQLMLLDGCFLLQMLITHDGALPGAPIPGKDPLFGPHGMTYNFPVIRRDMLLLENQIPFTVLVKLLATQGNIQELDTAAENVIRRDLVDRILRACNPKRWPLPETIYGCHILDVFRKSLILDDVSSPPRTYYPRQPSIMLRTASRRLASTSKKCCFGWLHSRVASVNRYLSQGRIAPVADPAWPVDVPNIRSATALREAGVVFRRSKGGSIRDIQFRRGVLNLPHISVDDATEGVLLNLMAYERMHESVDERSHRCEITSLVHFMGKFVDSARDVSLLRNKGIINNLLGSDAEVVQLFSKLSKDVPLDPECRLKHTYRELSVYCGRAWPKWTAYLRHNYFYKPWAFFSVCAALLLLVLAAAQVVFAILQYYECKKSGS